MPCATPRTSVVLPAPSSPVSRTTSPGRSRSPRRRPISSVSAGLFVVTSGKVVVAAGGQLDRRVPGVNHPHDAVVGQCSHDLESRLLDELVGTGALELMSPPAMASWKRRARTAIPAYRPVR